MNLFTIWSLYFSLEPLEKCMAFKDIFPGLSRFRNFEEKIHDLLSKRRGNPLCMQWAERTSQQTA